MGFFGRNRGEKAASEKDELKEKAASEVQEIQKELDARQQELDGITQKIQTVKEEYEGTVGSLMLVKKELNQKKMELDLVRREYRETRERIKSSEKAVYVKSSSQLKRAEGDLVRIKEEIVKYTKRHDMVKAQVEKEQKALAIIRKQHATAERELDEANSKLYNARDEIDNMDRAQDAGVLTAKEKEFIQAQGESQKNVSGVVEAASAIVGSLKSKLNMAQRELDAVQQLLEKEREEHERTRAELDRLRGK